MGEGCVKRLEDSANVFYRWTRMTKMDKKKSFGKRNSINCMWYKRTAMVSGAFLCFWSLITGIPRFTLLMWGHKNKTAEAKTA